MKIALILPSRGTIHSRTVEALMYQKDYPDMCVFMSHDKPIPDCFNDPINRALDDINVTHIWIVEEDVVPPPDALAKMLAVDEAVVAYDYPVGDEGAAVFCDDSHAFWSGMGCMLIKRYVLENYRFNCDSQYTISDEPGKLVLKARMDIDKGYGLQDVNFGIHLYSLGCPIRVMREPAQHLRVIKQGESQTNNGFHEIKPLPNYKRNDTFKWKKLEVR
jgi:hypothetical protein